MNTLFSIGRSGYHFNSLTLRNAGIFFLFAMLSSSVVAQQIGFRTYTISDGLVANSVRNIYQDSKGFIWVGTYEGLSRYDGYRFSNYTRANGLSHNLVNSVLEVDNKILVAENDGSLDVLEHGAVRQRFKAKHGLNTIKWINKRLLLSSDENGFYEYSNNQLSYPKQEKAESSTLHFVPYHDSMFLCTTQDAGLHVYAHDLSQRQVLKSEYFGELIFRDSQKRIWVNTVHGLQILSIDTTGDLTFSLSSIPSLTAFQRKNRLFATSISEGEKNSFWIGTSGGLLHLLPNGDIQFYTEQDGLPAKFITSILRDREGNMWIGTLAGLAKWASVNNLNYYKVDNVAFSGFNNAWGLFNNKFVLSYQTKVSLFDLGSRQMQPVRTTSNEYHLPVADSDPLLLYSAGQLWKFNGRGDAVEPFETLDSMLRGVYIACQHKTGAVFLGTEKGLVLIRAGKTKNLLPTRITSLANDDEGNIWVGTWNDGLYRVLYRKGKDQEYFELQKIKTYNSYTEIRSLYKDSQNRIWVGTRYAGAFCLTPTGSNQFKIQSFNRASGLSSDWVQSFAETSSGAIWVGTFTGLDKLIRQGDGYDVFNFSKMAGISGSNVLILAASDSNTWWCVMHDKLVSFEEGGIEGMQPPPVTILSVQLGSEGKGITVTRMDSLVTLSHQQNQARISFSAQSYFNEKQILYSYRMLGTNDTSWSRPQHVQEVFFASLQPGNYTFEVRTTSWNGLPGASSQFAFVILPPYWKTWWFMLLMMTGAALILFMLYRNRIKQIVRMQQVRNRIATDLHDDIGSTLTNISVLTELSKRNQQKSEKVETYLNRIREEVDASIQSLDDIIWSVNTKNDTFQELIARMRRYAAELFDAEGTKYELTMDSAIADMKIAMEKRRDLFLIFKEALNNIYKHASASKVSVSMGIEQDRIRLVIRDNGKGFDTHGNSHRNGIANLNYRVARWKGSVDIRSGKGQGTTIDVALPC